MFLEIDRLAVNFGGIRAVDGVSFGVDDRQILTIIGPNGAGKTTVLNLICRIFEPTEGSIRFGGRDITRERPHRLARMGLARTFQNMELFESGTVLQNMLLGRYVHRRTSLIENLLFLPTVRKAEKADRDAVETVVDFLALGDVADTLVGDLSYGTRKIVELGRALCVEPRLLLLDEPSSGLGPDETDVMARWITEIRRRFDIAILLIEHDMSLVTAVSDRVIALNQGRIVAEGATSDVLNDPDVISAYLGS